MKSIHLLVLVAAILVLCLAALAPALSAAQNSLPACAPPVFLDSDAGYVLCCCNTFSGTCCAYVSFCAGYIPGCLCTGG